MRRLLSVRQYLDHHIQELKELGNVRALYRISWELLTRTPLAESIDKFNFALDSLRPTTQIESSSNYRHPSIFAQRKDIKHFFEERLSNKSINQLVKTACEASNGKILCFGNWTADFGNPIDWCLNPLTGERRNSNKHWSLAMRQPRSVGDIKLTWEVARFPHAYHIARASVFSPQDAMKLSASLERQIQELIAIYAGKFRV